MIALVVIAGIFITVKVSAFNGIWSTYQDQVASRQKLLDDLKTSFGYGGGIHNFKNYVIRWKDKHAKRADTHLNDVVSTVNAYRRLKNLSPAEKQALGKIEAVAKLYLQAIPVVAKEMSGKTTVKAIDKIVKINDGPALEGFKVLKTAYDKLTTENTAAVQQGVDTVSNLILVIFFMIASLVIAFSLITRQFIIKKIHHMHGSLTNMVNGNITQDLYIPARPDELDELSIQINTLADQLRRMMRRVKLQSETLRAVVAESINVKTTMGKDAEESYEMTRDAVIRNSAVDQDFAELKLHIDGVSENFSQVAEAAGMLSSNINTIATSAEQASMSVASAAQASNEMTSNIGGINQALERVNSTVMQVATSMDEMAQSITQVVNSCESAQKESEQANLDATDTVQLMDKLAASAKAIGKVVELINDIAEQTNMLALNASIEAAGAGEAGKGFAVVANEVKELASQTGDATNLISQSIQEIQDNTQQAINAVGRVSQSITRIDSSNREITGLVGEQHHIVQGIGHSMEDATNATQMVTANTGELTQAADNVAEASQEAAHGAQQIADLATHAATEANNLVTLGDESKTLASEAQTMGSSIFEASAHVQKNGIKTMDLVNLMNGSIHQTGMLVDVIRETSDSLKGSADGIYVGAVPFNVETIKLAHLGWLTKLENVIRGREALSPGEVASGKQCAFGKWYYSEGIERFGTLPLFQEMGEVHLMVHELAREVVSLIHEHQDIEGAIKKMDQFNDVRRKLFEYLDKVYQDDEAIALSE
uniref:Putative Methyl-accepting chemotaxis protein n=1 Tax=Magnetococcus massalia (strain MO-1) TaxID=451514 RepID=A0A1S7LCS2_MAGMO|nr:putative Methyl-accepting chemotaxis protein [Candidatus Magnetococcus massalia]